VPSADCPAVPVAEVHSQCDWACRLACTRVAGHEGYRAGMKGPRQAGRPQLQAHRAPPACECSDRHAGSLLGSQIGLARGPSSMPSVPRPYRLSARSTASLPSTASASFSMTRRASPSTCIARSTLTAADVALAAREASLAATTAAVDACEVAPAASSARPAAGCPEARSEPRQDAPGARIGRGAGDGHPLLAGWSYPLRRSLP
jgi:hypothetical protein